MALVIRCVLLFLIEIIKLSAIMIGLMGFKPKKFFLYYLGGSVILLISSVSMALYFYPNLSFYNDGTLYNLISIYVLIFMTFVLKGRRKGLTALISFTSISLVDLVLSGVTLLIFDIDIKILLTKTFWDVYANSLSIVFLSFLIICKRKLKSNLSTSYFSFKRRYVVMVLLGIIGCGLYIAPIQILGVAVRASRYDKLISLGVTISGVAFIFVCVGLVIMNDSKMHYQNLSIMNEKLMKQQTIYYQTLIEKEEYTKRFRHDINNHIYCMQHLCTQKEYEELDQYLLNMRTHIDKLNINIETGNDIVNIIVNDIYAKSRNDNITFIWSGVLPSQFRISSMDICTIFSNLLINAVEAVRKVEDEQYRIIETNIKYLNNSILIEIKNSISEKVKIINQQLVTTKSDEEQHGFGTKNVRECVKKYNGNLQYTCTDMRFLVSIVFSNIMYE